MKRIKIENGKDQIIVKATEKPKLEAQNEQVQGDYKKLKLHKEFKNSPEEKIPENYVYSYLVENLEDWKVEPLFLGVNRFDISLKHRKKPISFCVEVKTKPEAPSSYVYKYNHPDKRDRSPGIPETKIGQILGVDFAFWFLTSKFSVISGYTDSSSMLLGVSSENHKELSNFRYFPATYKTTPYYAVELKEKPDFFMYDGHDALKKFVRYLDTAF